MTLVRTLQTRPNPDGTRRPMQGFFIWTPTERRIISGSPDEVVQPAGFAIELDLSGGFEVDVAATGTDWVWRVDERIEGLRTKTTYVVVPPEGPVDFTDLTQVNVSSLKSTAVPDHIWYVYTDYLAEQARLAKVSAANSEAAATSSQDSAAASALIASTKATAASDSATNALLSAQEADLSEAQALAYRDAAEIAKDNAAASQASAAGHASVAKGARDDAEVARVGAEEAQNAAEIAKSGSESARDESVIARDAAVAHATGFSVGNVITSSPGSIAEADISGVAPDLKLDLVLPRGEIGPSLNIGDILTITGPAAPGTVGPQGLTGPKGDPGGLTTAVTLGTGSDLNNYTDAGIYRAISGNATTVLNHPKDNLGGHLIVLRGASTIVTQLFYPLATNYRGFWQRNMVTSWTPWQFIASQRVDQSAGRAIYVWDDVNNRDQLIYGDTGWRELSSTGLLNGWTANSVLIRRVNNLVSFKIYQLNPSAATADIFTQIPAGFIRTHGAGTILFPKSNAEVAFLQLTSGGMTFGTRGVAVYGTGGFCEVQWTTAESWPTSLPGTASGSISNT